MKRASRQRLTLDRETIKTLIVELPVDKLEQVRGGEVDSSSNKIKTNPDGP